MQSVMRRSYDWGEIWQRRLSEYLAARPRAGMMINRLLSGDFQTVLEIACGSARDSLYLQSIGKEVVASDGEPHVISELKRRFAGVPHIDFRVEDATALSFDADEFDVSFHNGFYVIFDDDETIKALLREQCRVTREHVFFLVHNAHNAALRQRFEAGAHKDSVLDIRFFSRHEIVRLVRESGVGFRRLNIYKFGGRADLLLAERLKGVPNPLCEIASRFQKELYSLTPLSNAERLICHLTL